MITDATNADLIFSATTPTVSQIDSIAGGALGRGIDAFLDEHYELAIKEFKRTIALSPYSDNAFNAYDYMATAQIKNNQPLEAEKTYKQSIKMFPTADGFRLNFGHLLFSEERYTEAAEQYASAVNINPSASQNRYSLGQAYLALGRYDDAAEQFKKVISMEPRDSSGYYALGQTYRMAGKADEAQVELDKALALKDDFPYAHYELGLLYADQGEIAAAREKLEIISDDLPDMADDLQTRIYENSAPKVISAYTASLNLASHSGTSVSSLDSSLATPEAEKNFTVHFIFDKTMDTASIQNIDNWRITRSTSYRTGGPYNWGIAVPQTETALPLAPAYVIYDSKSNTADLTFTIAQNASGDGTIDLSHLVFKFSGVDSYGNSIDASADEYNYISGIV